MTHYWVISPQIEGLISASAMEPPETFACAVSVSALTTRAAKTAALREPGMREWVQYQRADAANPFVGLRVIPAECPHGVCSCDQCQADHDVDQWCEECEAERESTP